MRIQIWQTNICHYRTYTRLWRVPCEHARDTVHGSRQDGLGQLESPAGWLHPHTGTHLARPIARPVFYAYLNAGESFFPPLSCSSSTRSMTSSVRIAGWNSPNTTSDKTFLWRCAASPHKKKNTGMHQFPIPPPLPGRSLLAAVERLFYPPFFTWLLAHSSTRFQ